MDLLNAAYEITSARYGGAGLDAFGQSSADGPCFHRERAEVREAAAAAVVRCAPGTGTRRRPRLEARRTPTRDVAGAVQSLAPDRPGRARRLRRTAAVRRRRPRTSHCHYGSRPGHPAAH